VLAFVVAGLTALVLAGLTLVIAVVVLAPPFRPSPSSSSTPLGSSRSLSSTPF
jgi:hypothetical protein